MRKLAKLIVLAVVVAPALASAQVTLGARLGYAFATGEIDKGTDLSDGISSQVPIQLDVGYRLSPKLTLGGYFAYGFGQLGNEFDGCSDCSARIYRLGLQLDYAFKGGSTTPWIGAGLGYEWASISNDAVDQSIKFSGFEFLNLQGGLDWKVGDKFSVGPFAMFSLGNYSTASMTGEGSQDIDGMHQWLQLGVRGKFDL